MDEMVLQRAPEGRHGSGDGQARRRGRSGRTGLALAAALSRVSAPDPVFLATAVEIVLRAGEIQMSRRESGFQHRQEGHDRSRDRGRSRVRADVPRGARRALSGSRHPGGRVEQRTAAGVLGALPLGLRSARRHDELRARPARVLCLARARDRRPAGGRRDLRPDAQGAVHR